jgi:hypothetical protein
MRSISFVFAAAAFACGSTSSIPQSSVGPSSFTLTMTSSGAGALQAAGTACRDTKCAASFAAGSKIEVTAAADSGATFQGFTGDCSGMTCALTMDADHAVTGAFVTIPPPPPPQMVQLTVAVDGPGAVRSTPAGIDCPATCSASFARGTVVELATTPAKDAQFKSWDGGCTGSAACQLTMTAAARVSATFVQVAPDECAGLAAPALGPPVQVDTGHSIFGGCTFAATTDGQGTVILGTDYGIDNGGDVWEARSPAGARLGFFGTEPRGQERPYPRDAGFQWFVSGWIISPSSGLGHHHARLERYRPDGTRQSQVVLEQTQPSSRDLPPAVWRSGNGAETVVVTHVEHGSGSAWSLVSQRFDADSALLSAGTVAKGSANAPTAGATGVALGGESLTLFDDGAGVLLGRFLDAGSNPLGPSFAVASGVTDKSVIELRRLLDGTLALRIDGAYRARISSSGTVSAAPAFLTSRQDWTLSFTARRTGYVMISQNSGFPSCGEPLRAALISPSGKTCHQFDLPSANACPIRGYAGFDGTLIVTGYNPDRDTREECSARYWPTLLK